MDNRYREDPDVRLMLRVRDGDESAFETLVETWAPVLVSFMFRFVGSASVAEDLSQEAFMKVYRAAPDYEPKAGFKTWLLTIATNLCLNQKRWDSKRRHFSLDAAIENGDGKSFAGDLSADAETPREEAERRELREKVKEAILALPEQQRAAMVLARYERMSYAGIGEVMRVSAMAVKSLLNRAKENLRERLERELKEYLVTPNRSES